MKIGCAIQIINEITGGGMSHEGSGYEYVTIKKETYILNLNKKNKQIN